MSSRTVRERAGSVFSLVIVFILHHQRQGPRASRSLGPQHDGVLPRRRWRDQDLPTVEDSDLLLAGDANVEGGNGERRIADEAEQRGGDPVYRHVDRNAVDQQIEVGRIEEDVPGDGPLAQEVLQALPRGRVQSGVPAREALADAPARVEDWL